MNRKTHHSLTAPDNTLTGKLLKRAALCVGRRPSKRGEEFSNFTCWVWPGLRLLPPPPAKAWASMAVSPGPGPTGGLWLTPLSWWLLPQPSLPPQAQCSAAGVERGIVRRWGSSSALKPPSAPGLQMLVQVAEPASSPRSSCPSLTPDLRRQHGPALGLSGECPLQ